jgi:site-specific DNA recombinase
MNGIVYCRVSSKEQIEGTSLESQEAACRDYARSKDIRLLKVFVEQGESAKFADRTKLVELIDFCKENKGTIEVLLVWKVDRFARNVSDHYSVKSTLAKYGVRIVSVTEPIDANPEGKLMETILAGFAQFDNDLRATRTVQGMRRKIQEGIFPWRPPFGYRSSVIGDEKKTLPDVPDETVFRLLQKAWKEFATGTHTQAEMGRLMGAWGLTTARGRRSFSPESVNALFINPFYAGILRDPWSGEEYEGKHLAMVTREDFARVQQVLARRNRSVVHQKDNPEFPLRGVVRCDGCDYYLTAGFSSGRSQRYPYYTCHKPSCPKRNKSYSVTHVHNEFDTLLDRLAPQPDVIFRLTDHIVEAAQERQKEMVNQRQRHHKQTDQLDREIQELMRMRAQHLITDQEFVGQKRHILAKRHSLDNREANAVSVDEVRHQIREIVNPLAELRETWHALRPPFRKRFNRMLLPVGFVNGKSRTAQTGLLFSTIGTFVPGDSTGVPLTSEQLNRLVQEISEFQKIFSGS